MSDGSSPRFLQGAFEFDGSGYGTPVPLSDLSRYVVPAGATAQPVYFRGGNSSGCVQQRGVRVGPDQRYRRVVAE
ncbi:hypothetical protein ACNUDN_03382 [Mycobacterium sp. smrl_JER01]